MPKSIFLLIGEPEYNSHISMPPFIDTLKGRMDLDVTVSISSVIPDNPDFPVSTFPDLEKLADADLLVVFTRFRVLPSDQMEKILSYVKSKRPVVGLRTANHAFKFPEENPYSKWNLGFGSEVLGAPWRTHYGGRYGTRIAKIAEMADHPVLEGVEPSFRVRSWLYHVLPLSEGCDPLLIGSTENPENDSSTDNPVAWVRSLNGRKVFYTSLGHPEDFGVDSFTRLLENGIRWALD